MTCSLKVREWSQRPWCPWLNREGNWDMQREVLLALGSCVNLLSLMYFLGFRLLFWWMCGLNSLSLSFSSFLFLTSFLLSFLLSLSFSLLIQETFLQMIFPRKGKLTLPWVFFGWEKQVGSEVPIPRNPWGTSQEYLESNWENLLENRLAVGIYDLPALWHSAFLVSLVREEGGFSDQEDQEFGNIHSSPFSK